MVTDSVTTEGAGSVPEHGKVMVIIEAMTHGKVIVMGMLRHCEAGEFEEFEENLDDYNSSQIAVDVASTVVGEY
jgi:hypothetical protein